MNQSACCDWLPEPSCRSGLPAVSRKQNFTKSHIINPLLTKFVWSRYDGWILASFFFCEFMDLDFVSVHTHAKKELGQYPAVLTSHLVNNPYIRAKWLIRSARTCISGFCNMKQPGVFLLPPGWDASPSQGYSQH